MNIILSDEMKGKEINLPDVENVIMKALITKNEGAPNFSLRQFELGINGHTPCHKHPWEHEVYVLQGMGELIFENGSTTLMPGNAVFVPGEELHQFKNRGEGIFKFLCIVPNEGHS